ncbi:MAG TPA: DNA polymerase IV [Pleomorphomonadaceae bacterium]|nr:DNA polymerase IV [Pleomorphomonadaceae bacterium]
MRTIIHADLDAYYASVEVLDNPSLRGLPVIVGGRPDDRGVVSAASYEARGFGVHSAMPLRTAARLCPQGVFLPGRVERYAEVSLQVMRIFGTFTPLVEPISLDEAFLDASGAPAGDGRTIGQAIKDRIQTDVGLVVSVGVATNKLVAKVASDLRKPDALVVVEPGDEAAFLAPLSVSRLWGVGPRVRQALADYGVTTIGQLAAVPEATLRRRFGRHGVELGHRARGIDPSPVVPGHAPKSIGHERTFNADVTERTGLDGTLLWLSESVAGRLRRHKMAAGGVQLKLRYEGFETLTRQATLPHPTTDAQVLLEVTHRLLDRTLQPGRAVRLIGITAISLVDAQQLTLFGDGQRVQRLAEAADAVREKFGDRAIIRARLLREAPERRFSERPPES